MSVFEVVSRWLRSAVRAATWARRAALWLRARLFGCVLLGITLVLFAIAIAILPHEPGALENSNVFQVQVNSTIPLAEVDLDEAPYHGGTRLTLVVKEQNGPAQQAASQGTQNLVNAFFWIPPGTLAEKQCAEKGYLCGTSGPAQLVGFQIPEKLVQTLRRFQGTATIVIPAHGAWGYGAVANGAYAKATIPQFQVQLNSAPAAVPVVVGFVLPSAGQYSWLGPSRATIHPAGVSWLETTEVITPGFDMNGVNDLRSQRDDQATFISGVVLGIAGATAVAALTEFFTVYRRHRKREEAETAETPPTPSVT
jgi:hypothetical protein